MRTDSTTLSDTALAAARSQATELYGPEYVPPQPRKYERRVKNAQEAHEAIRPAGDVFRTPGQVAGDALLCRIPCVGGNGTVERLAFPDLCGHGRTPERLFDLATRLLEHPYDCVAIVEKAVEFAKATLSYSAVSRQLENFYRRFQRAS